MTTASAAVVDDVMTWAWPSEAELRNLTDWQRATLRLTSDPAGQRCLLTSWKRTTTGLHCNATWDGYRCWPGTPANTTVTQPCPMTFSQMLPDSAPSEAVGYRSCLPTGDWQHGNWTNYSLCFLLPVFEEATTAIDADGSGEVDTRFQSLTEDGYFEKYHQVAVILRDIYFVGSIVSLVLLIVALFIFSYFRSLQCARISIHKNLVASFILRSAVVAATFEPFVTGRLDSYRSVDWMCKTLVALNYYSTIANTAWMFVEGLFLHSRLTVSVFQKEDPFVIYYIVGWGLPAPIVLSWVVCMHIYNPNKCWSKSFDLLHSWIIGVPIITFLAMNLLFLINIVRIVVTKLGANSTVDADHKIRTAVRATLVLFPLLGLTNVLFSIEPISGVFSVLAYRITNAVLQSSQGIFVSLIYCFFNQEVRTTVARKWYVCVQLRTIGRVRRQSYASVTNVDATQNNAVIYRQHKLRVCPTSQDVIMETPPPLPRQHRQYQQEQQQHQTAPAAALNPPQFQLQLIE